MPTDEGRILQKIVQTGIEISSISSEKDGLRVIQGNIIDAAKFVTGAEYASVYIKEGNSLRIISTDSSLEDMIFLLDGEGIAPYVARTRTIVNEPDLHVLEEREYKYRVELEEKTRRRLDSMIALPMINPGREGIVGVLQVMNKRKDGNTVPFDDQDIELLKYLTSQGAVAIENAVLHRENGRFLENIVRCLASAIDSRDPYTSGHSARVGNISTRIAEEMNQCNDYVKMVGIAALLHDIGKIGVRENVLMKESRLSGKDMDVLALRYRLMEELMDRSQVGIITQLKEDLSFLLRMNGSWEHTDIDNTRLRKIFEKGVVRDDIYGQSYPYLTHDEYMILSIKEGNLTPAERAEIQKHALYTSRILREIEFPTHLQDIQHFAAYHHERLDGSGYPFALKGNEIPLGARIIGMADVYDAVTSIRPYRKPFSSEDARRILRKDVEDGRLDSDVYNTFERIILP